MSRNKRDACRYETGAPTAQGRGERSGKEPRISADVAARSVSAEEPEDGLPTKVADFGYSQTGASTLGFLRRIDGANPGEPLGRLASESRRGGENYGTRERYKSLVRQLPARVFVDKLVDIYFRDFNWQYLGLDDDVFSKQLEEWNSVPLDLFNTGGPQALSPDLRAFPALLFHVLATALLVLSPDGDPEFDSLKYAANMSFEDLAVDYSESGVAILSLLGKRQMSITTVLAGFTRASFLKFIGLVTEAVRQLREDSGLGCGRMSIPC